MPGSTRIHGGAILEPNVIILAVAVVIALAGLAAVVTGRFGPRRPDGRSGGLPGVVDRSIGMYVLRRLAGRPAVPPPTGVPAAPDAGDEASLRGRVVPTRARTEVYGPPATARGDLPQPAPAPGSGSPLPRHLLVRDAGVALAALTAVALVVVAFWPGAGTPREGGVLGITRGGPTGESAEPASIGSPSLADPNGSSDPAGSPPPPEPVATTASTARPVATGAVAPTARPVSTAAATRTPTPTSGPTATPGSTATAGPTATPATTPEPTPTPTPEPTPEPTPVPTPTPVPDPVAAFSCSVNDLTLTCDGSASTDAAAYGWTFGDGATASVAQPSHTYAAPGTYTVELTVTNVSGSDSRTQVFTLP